MKKVRHSGFTLIEILVAIAVIAVMASVVIANMGQGSGQARDAERLSDIRNIESALERYRLQNGRYPAGCNDPAPGTWDGQGEWSGQLGTDFECADGTGEYIVGLAPEFIPVLPTDPRLNGSDSGYVYSVSEDGEVFKFMALNTVEEDDVGLRDEFSRCGDINRPILDCANVPFNPLVSGDYNDGANGETPEWCRLPGINNDYAISSGYASRSDTIAGYRTTPKAREYATEQIRCK